MKMNILKVTGSSLLLLLLGIASAYAEAAAGAAPASAPTQAGQSGSLMSFLPMLLILVFFMYFMVIRPQSKRVKEHKKLVTSLKVGDEVVTLGGMFGKIEKLGEDSIVLNIAENVNITIQKSAVSHSVPKGTIKSASK